MEDLDDGVVEVVVVVGLELGDFADAHVGSGQRERQQHDHRTEGGHYV